ncbi:unnamed protein product, partial [marine sediment metagenome]
VQRSGCRCRLWLGCGEQGSPSVEPEFIALAKVAHASPMALNAQAAPGGLDLSGKGEHA